MKRAKLILAQIDHVSGEIIGFAVGRIMEIGANNVHIIPTITKKNRPGNIFIIDTDVEHEKKIAHLLAQELKVSGYHRINTEHIFQRVTFVKKNLKIKMNGKSRTIKCDIKVIGDPSKPMSVNIEHDFLVKVQKFLMDKWDSSISVDDLRTAIEAKLKESKNEITIDL